MVTLIRMGLASLFSLGLVYVALLIPAHWATVTPAVLVASGKGTVQVEDIVTALQQRGQVSAVRWLRALPDELGGVVDDAVVRTLGGPNPYFAMVVARLGVLEREGRPLLASELFARKAVRGAVNGLLSQSRLPGVVSIMSLKDRAGFRRFAPVQSAMGAPLEGTIHLLAFLEQGEWLPVGIAERLGRQAELAEVERALSALMSLGMHWDTMQLALWIRQTSSTDEWVKAAQWLGEFPQARRELWLAYQMGAAAYFWSYWQEGQFASQYEALRLAISYGAGAVERLLSRGEVVYQPPAWLQKLPLWEEALVDSSLLAWSLTHIDEAFFLKIFCLWLAGWSWVYFVLPSRRLGFTLVVVRNAGLACLGALLILLMIEPALLVPVGETPASLRLDFNLTTIMERVQSQPFTMGELDPITLFFLAIFFLIQLVIYIFGLIKLYELKKQGLPPYKTLELLENEESLFDSGLYVGLGGTVLSLIILVLGVVEASLVAAYASTLFGIIFVAVLKIFHVRPLKRHLLLQ